MTTKQRKKQVEALREQVEAGLHPMQSADPQVRKKAATQIAEKMIAQALCEPQNPK
jgi:hypothetical protein